MRVSDLPIELQLNPEFLSQCFLLSLSPDPELRRAAETNLTEALERPSYAVAVVRVAAEPCVAEHIRQAAALNLKNHLHRRWAAIAEDEKHQIKGFLVALIVSSPPHPPRIQSQTQMNRSLSLANMIFPNHGLICYRSSLLTLILLCASMITLPSTPFSVHNLLSSYAANPATNWKDKDCAIYLVVSLATGTIVDGCVTYRSDLVNVENFFTQVILPELETQDLNELPLLKAAALRFFTVFRSQIPKPLVVQLLPVTIRFLRAESNVVRSYAAICIEMMFLVKDEAGGRRYTSPDIAPFVQLLMNNLFNALKFPEYKENQHIMRCIMRVLRVAEISPDIPKPCMDGFSMKFAKIPKIQFLTSTCLSQYLFW